MSAVRRALVSSLISVLAVAVAPETTHAYGGPGSVITGIGAFRAALAAVAAAMLGFLWFPVKKLVGKIRDDRPAPEAETAEGQEEALTE